MGRTETSVAEALRQTHAALLDDLRKLEQAVRPASEKGLAVVRARLDATHAHITEHFRFEEQNGYMETVRKREPRLERAIQQLIEEHHQLTQSLDALIGEARAAASLDDTVRAEVQRWLECVRRHEVRENDLIQDAFDLDIGGEA
jgi:hypothetical protein